MKIDKEGYIIIRNTIIGSAVIITAIGYFCPTVAIIIAGILLILNTLVIRFFRLPKRELKQESNSVFSPADGTVVVCEKVFEDEYLKKECMQISVFMSIHNVHANWYPMDGIIEYFRHHHGEFMVAWHPKSSTDNERTTVVIRNGSRQILIRQIAGLVARRIMCYAEEDTHIKQNDRLGFIKFGSRLDVFVPLDAEIKVKLNQKVTGSQSILAKFADKI